MRQAYLDAAEVALTLLRDPAVAERWSEPSALADFSVGGLAAHLAVQVLRTDQVLAAPPPQEAPIDVLEHYRRSAWVSTDLDSEANIGIREGGEALAAPGPVAVVDNTAQTLQRVRELLAPAPADRVVALPWTGWSLTLDDFLLTRTMEIVVHGDDLAVSVGVETPAMPAAATDPVIRLLAGVAAQRHGAYPLIRALSRAERAPETISAF